MRGLFERSDELAELDARLAATVAGEGSLSLVEGPAGIGKSRLLTEFRRQARDTVKVLSARGSELEEEFAFGVVRQLFEAEVAGNPSLLAGAAAPAAMVFGAVETEGASASFAALHGLYWLVLNLAEDGPLLLCVDDLHWADPPSLRFLGYLARRLEGQPVLLVAGLRDGEPGTDPALLQAIAGDPAAALVRPGPLNADSISRIIVGELGAAPAPEFTATCLEATGGSPLLLTQLLSALSAEGVTPSARNTPRILEIGPRAVSRTVLRRLDQLGGDARAVARAVSVLDEGAEVPVVARLAGVSEAALTEATRGLTAAGILRSEPPLAFAHPLVRDAVYNELSPAERERDHRTAAGLLRDAAARPERVAAQLLNVDPRGEAWVVDLLRQAAGSAARAGAPDSAGSYLRRALAENAADRDRPALLLETGLAEALVTGPGAVAHLSEAYASATDPVSRATAAAVLGRLLMFLGVPEDPAELARRTAAGLPAELAELRSSLEAFEFMTGFFGVGPPSRLRALREFRGLRGGGPGSHMLTAMAAFEALCSDGTAAECAELSLAALEGGVLLRADPNLIFYAPAMTLALADRPEVDGVWAPALADAYDRGDLVTIGSVHLWQGFSDFRRGDLAAAEEALRASLGELDAYGHGAAASLLTRGILVEVLRERGRIAEATELFELLGTIDTGWSAVSYWHTARANFLLSTGRAEEAVAVVDELAARCAEGPNPTRLWWRSLKAEALVRLGRHDEALALARTELVQSREFGAPATLARTLRVLGSIEGGEPGLAHLREAAEVVEASTNRLEAAWTLAAYGAALRRARQPSEARSPLLRALDLAIACEAEPLVSHVRTELQAAGVRPRRDAISGVDSLTPSERRVVELAATGRANRDIAQELYVTPKTVEVHLSNAYRKLGIKSRAELAKALATP